MKQTVPGWWKPVVMSAIIGALGLVVQPAVAESSAAAEQQDAVPLEQLRIFAEVFGRIKQDYVESVDDKKLLDDAIRGMLNGLDPHSSYLTDDQFKDLQEGTSGEFGGLGIEVGMEDGFVKVVSPIDDTPAQRAGIKSGDFIVRIDGKPVKGMSLDDAVTLMRGKPGSKIELTVLREGEDKPLEFTIERAVIKVASVKGRLLAPGFAYLRLSQFQSNTAEEMLKKIDALQKENKAPLQGMVLDLRNNPGGVLNSAVTVSDAFLTGGKIVYTEGRDMGSQLKFSAAQDDVLDGAPIVVLVNSGSASASEIVAGALQDHGRALIVGEETFGKGSVQTIIPINNSAALKLTTARYYTPNGRSIQAEGIMPDIELEEVVISAKETEASLGDVKESDLAHHLENENGDEAEDAEGNEDSLILDDYQLSMAFNILKGMAIQHSRAN